MRNRRGISWGQYVSNLETTTRCTGPLKQLKKGRKKREKKFHLSNSGWLLKKLKFIT